MLPGQCLESKFFLHKTRKHTTLYTEKVQLYRELRFVFIFKFTFESKVLMF